MIVDEIRSKRNAVPFQPFTIRRKNGKRYRILRPYDVAVAPWNGSIGVVSSEGAEIIRARDLERTEIPNEKALALVERIRAIKQREPFKPFSIRLKSGETLAIPSPEAIGAPPETLSLIFRS